MIRWLFSVFKAVPVFVTGFFVGAIVGIVFVTSFAWRSWHFSTDFLNELLKRETVDRFEIDAIKIAGKQSLNVARFEANESFERTEKTQALWISLPDVVVRARLPVQFNYFVSVSPAWKFERRGDTLVVNVPELGSSRPAVDVSAMRLEVVNGSIFRSGDAAKQDLQKELSDWLIERAVAHREEVRAEARLSVEAFVRTWAKQATGRELLTPIEVHFPSDVADRAR